MENKYNNFCLVRDRHAYSEGESPLNSDVRRSALTAVTIDKRKKMV